MSTLSPKFHCSNFEQVFSARHHICYSALYTIAHPSVRPSVCLSVTRVDQSKAIEVRVMQLYYRVARPHDSIVSSWLTSPRNSEGNIGSGAPNRQTDGQTDRRTDNIRSQYRALHKSASRGKKPINKISLRLS